MVANEGMTPQCEMVSGSGDGMSEYDTPVWEV